MRNFTFAIVALCSSTVAAAVSCTVVDGEGEGGSSSEGGATGEGGDATTTTSTSTTTTSTTTTTTTTSTNTNCLSCLNYVEAALGNMPFDTSMMCGYTAGTPAPASSYGLLLALGDCNCDPNAGGCETDCAETCTGSGMDMEPACSDCQQDAIGNACASEFNACTADTMGTEG